MSKAGTQAGSAYTPYTGGFTSDQQAAFSNIANLNGTSNPTFSAASNAITGALNPTYNTVGNYMNPYVQNVVNSTIANMNELNGQQQQQVIGNAISKGAMGGNRLGVAQAELARQQGLANNQQIAQLYSDAYNNALGAAQNQQQVGLNAAAGLSDLGQTQMNTNLAQAAAQLGAGTQQQQFNYQQYLNQQGFPYSQLSWLSGVINGTGPNAGGTTTQTTPYGNIFSQLLGAGLGVASLFKRGGVVHAANGGVMPFSNQGAFMQGSSDWGNYLDAGMPYANDNAIYLPYIPEANEPISRPNFPQLQDYSDNENDALSDLPNSVLRRGAGNVKDWVNSLFSRSSGGVVPHLAGGGVPDVNDIYSGIIMPQGGLYQPGPPVMLPSSGQFSDLVQPTGAARRYDDVGLGPAAYGYGMIEDQMHDLTPASDLMSKGNGLTWNGVKFEPSNGASTWYPTSLEGAPTSTGKGLAYTTPVSNPALTNGAAKAATTLAGGDSDLIWEPAETGVLSPDQQPGWGSAYINGLDRPAAKTGLVTGPRPVAVPSTRSGSSGLGGLAQLFHPSSGITLNAPKGEGKAFNGSLAPSGSPASVAAKGLGQNALMPASMNNSRWLTGYADGGNVGGDHNGPTGVLDWEHSGLDGIMRAYRKAKLHWKGRPESTNIEDRRDPIARLIEDGELMSTDHFSHGEPMLPSDHFSGPAPHLASGGKPREEVAYDGPILMPPTVPNSTDTTTGVIDGDNLGLGYGNGIIQDMPAPNATPDNLGMNQPPAPNAGGIPLVTYDNTKYGNDNSGVVPYATGASFVTQPQPQYSQNIGDAWKSLTSGHGLNLSPDMRQSLLAAGLGMMASRSPFALQGIGEGGLEGIAAWQKRQEIERENAKARADIAQRGQEIATTAAQTGQNLGLTQASTGATRYTFTTAPGGVTVTDSLNPAAVLFVPWGGILPDGTVATQNSGSSPTTVFQTIAPRAPMDRRLMTNTTAGQVMEETNNILNGPNGAYSLSASAARSQQQLQELQGALEEMPDTGWLSPGTQFGDRLDFARAVNTASHVIGGDDLFPPEQIAAGEDVEKVTKRLGYELSKTVGSDAADIVMTSIEAVPSGINSKAGAEKLISSLRAQNQRNIDYYNFMQSWAGQNNGSLLGAAEYFNRVNPPELYAIMGAYQVPSEDIVYLRAHPEAAKDFNEYWGHGKDIAKYVLGAR